ncbi:chemotaxis protein [Gottschalkia acidurici]|nr:chemotaxis protein [Gottschalkia acidurici]
MENKILLETGTNELEIVVFKVGKGIFGINVAKVESIITHQPITQVPNMPEGVEGVINHRGQVINVIRLEEILNFPSGIPEKDRFFIVTHFNNNTYAFEVSSVVGINRLSWEDIEQPSDMINNKTNSPLVGIVKKEDIILLLDFEKIVSDNTSVIEDNTKFNKSLDLRGKKVVIAEDSPFLINVLEQALENSGVKDIVKFKNGADTWEYINSLGSIDELFCLITDIEMPSMDGLTLTKKIKENKIYNKLPVILFSSLISEDLKHRGESVGADAQISKPEFEHLIDVLKKFE